MAEVYRLYQRRLKEYDAMDFDDLIGNYVQLIEKHEDVRDEIHTRFRHILIDEYQDTNRAQYLWVRALAARHRQPPANDHGAGSGREKRERQREHEQQEARPDIESRRAALMSQMVDAKRDRDGRAGAVSRAACAAGVG